MRKVRKQSRSRDKSANRLKYPQNNDSKMVQGNLKIDLYKPNEEYKALEKTEMIDMVKTTNRSL